MQSGLLHRSWDQIIWRCFSIHPSLFLLSTHFWPNSRDWYQIWWINALPYYPDLIYFRLCSNEFWLCFGLWLTDQNTDLPTNGGGGSEWGGMGDYRGGGGGVCKEGERKEGDVVTLWCSFWLWTRSNWMPFPLLFVAAVWLSIWPCLFVQAWLGMRLLFHQWSRDNQPRWASLDKLVLCLHIPCVDSHSRVSSFPRLLLYSPPKVQWAQQWWHAWLCRTISQRLVVPGYAWYDVASEELLLGQQLSSSPLRLRNFCPCDWLNCRGRASSSWRKLMHGLGHWVGLPPSGPLTSTDALFC